MTHHKRPADKPSAGRFLLYPQLPVGAGLCSPAESAVFTEIPGEIVQQGTHDDLINADGLYRRFVVERRQAGRSESLPHAGKGPLRLTSEGFLSCLEFDLRCGL